MARFIVFALVLLAAAGSAAAQSTARTLRIPSAAIGQRVFSVLLPAAYEQSEARYPVMYLLHGGGQDHTAFMARRDFARRARVVDMIVVMPAADRGGVSPVLATRYEDFLARELVAYVDANFRTVATPSGRAIAGLSLGGMFAVGTGLRYPDVFGIVGAFSAAAARTEQPVPAENATTYFYISCGAADSLVGVSRQLVDSLRRVNAAHEYHEIPGFGHAWAFWDPQIDAFFERLLSRPGWHAAAAKR
jgi:enterochelin esterase-like enzyme